MKYSSPLIVKTYADLSILSNHYIFNCNYHFYHFLSIIINHFLQKYAILVENYVPEDEMRLKKLSENLGDGGGTLCT